MPYCEIYLKIYFAIQEILPNAVNDVILLLPAMLLNDGLRIKQL